MDDIADLESASKIKESNSQLNVIMVPNFGHAVSKYIQKRIPLSILILNFFTNKNFNLFEYIDKIIPPSIVEVEKLKELHNKAYSEEAILLIKSDIQNLSKNYPNWSKIQFLLAKIYFLENELQKSKKMLEIAISNIYDELERIRLKLALSHFKRNQFKKGLVESNIMENKNHALDVSKLLVLLYGKDNA